MKMLITGGAGFIGSEFTRQALDKGFKVSVIDSLTYAGDLNRLKEIKGRFTFYKVDIRDGKRIGEVLSREKPDFIIHFAAETHVDRSIKGSSPFIQTNIGGTQTLLDAAKKIGIKKFIHISTDEVYGDIKRGQFSEHSNLNPSSPYSASKAAGDLLVKSYIRTFKFPALIIRPSNNYGPWQYPEKFIPVVIYNALKNNKIPVYARGLNVREWLYVSDCCKAVMKTVEKGKIGEIYNIGSGFKTKNIDVAREILSILGKPLSLIEFVTDRPGHDFRYSLNCKKIREGLNWKPKVKFENGLKKTVDWYCKNLNWLENKAR